MAAKRWFSRFGESGAGVYLLAALAAILLLFCSKGAFKDQADGQTDLETRLETVLSKIDGAGEVCVMVMEGEEMIHGVLIVAEGAENISVRLRIQEAARILLGIENEKISVARMGDEADEGG